MFHQTQVTCVSLLCATALFSVQASASAPSQVPTSVSVTVRTVQASGPLVVVGVVSANMFHALPYADMLADATQLTRRSDVDVVGWQESETDKSRRVFAVLRRRGWRTVYWPDLGRETAISFRTSVFGYVSGASMKMHNGAVQPATQHPFPARWTNQVTLVYRATGFTLTLLNTHVNQKIELLPEDESQSYTPGFTRPGLNLDLAKIHLAKLHGLISHATARWVLITGDFNFDFVGDRNRRPQGMPWSALSDVARSSFQQLGLGNLRSTQIDRHRFIDYVWARRSDLVTGRSRFVRHTALTGYHSDHRPLLARVALY